MIKIRNTSVPIVIIQFAPFYHHGGLGIARSAGRLGIPVYWVHGQSWTPPILSRYVSGSASWNADASAHDLVQFLLDWGLRLGRQSVLIPIDDMGAIFVADHAESLRGRFLFPTQPDGLTRSLSSKREMELLCRAMDVPTPEAAYPHCGEDVALFAETAAFPVVLKRIANWSPEHRTEMKSVTILRRPRELLEAFEKIETQGEPNVMLQEYIPGGPESVWMFNGVFTDRSECIAGFTGKKIRQAPPLTGATTLGICLKNEAVEELTMAFMQRIGYSGVVDMGYRFDGRDGQYKLLDVNPRVGATFRLFVDSNGMDVVRALYLDLTGQPVLRGVPREGRKWIVEQSDLRSSLQYGRLGMLTVREWVRSLRGIEEGAWFARDDPVPVVAVSSAYFAKAGRRATRQVRAAVVTACCKLVELSRRCTRYPKTSFTSRGVLGLPDGDHHKRVGSYFDSISSYWQDIYSAGNLEGEIYRHRQAVALAWIDELALPTGARVLDVGCGAGLMMVELARRGYAVDGIDMSDAMVERALRNAVASGVGDRVNVFRGDVHSLPLENKAFDLVLAIGVVPWLESPATGVREMARVVTPGGYVLLTSDNRARLTHLLDPRLNSALGPLRRSIRHLLEVIGLRGLPSLVPHEFHSASYVDRLIFESRLQKAKAATVGFGPFSFLGRRLLPDSVEMSLNRRLQELADRGVVGIRSTGSQYLVLTRKRPDPLAVLQDTALQRSGAGEGGDAVEVPRAALL